MTTAEFGGPRFDPVYEYCALYDEIGALLLEEPLTVVMGGVWGGEETMVARAGVTPDTMHPTIASLCCAVQIGEVTPRDDTPSFRFMNVLTPGDLELLTSPLTKELNRDFIDKPEAGINLAALRDLLSRAEFSAGETEKLGKHFSEESYPTLLMPLFPESNLGSAEAV